MYFMKKLKIAPIAIAHKNPPMILRQNMLGLWLNANRVDVMTSGFTIGADAMKVIPIHIGTFFLRSSLRSGTETHSQTGITSHMSHANG